jgi:hypothetical protein
MFSAPEAVEFHLLVHTATVAVADTQLVRTQ